MVSPFVNAGTPGTGFSGICTVAVRHGAGRLSAGVACEERFKILNVLCGHQGVNYHDQHHQRLMWIAGVRLQRPYHGHNGIRRDRLIFLLSGCNQGDLVCRSQRCSHFTVYTVVVRNRTGIPLFFSPDII